jgi:hypothetical protein
MISGLNQDVEVLGKTLHVQTELSGGRELSIRTEVFLGGKLVATREQELEEGERDRGEAHLRALMKEQHQKILESVVERAKRYQERRAEEPAPGETSLDEAPVPPFQGEAGGPPSVAGQGSVEIALRVRRLFEKFRLRLGELPEHPGEHVDAYLERAAHAFAWILGSPLFPEIRIDEQVRFNLLKDQVDEWLHGGRSAERGVEIWSEILTFNRYLAQVNNRGELAAFDRDLLSWSLRKLETEGMTERVLEHLAMIYGRDAELDLLLERPLGVSDEVWAANLRRVLNRLEAVARR